MALGENFSLLGSLVEKVSEIGLPFLAGRVKLIDCICNFVLLEPRIAQILIGRLLGMLSDLDYRVRLFLARRLGILFLTWDGHNELFHDICSNFGVELVRASNEVLDLGVQSVLSIETAVITLAHLAYFSEKVEVKYDSRTKYLEELLGSILARWIDCEVSLTDYWRGNIQSLELISEVAKQPLPLLVKEFFVPIFAVCMAVYCNGKDDEGNSGKVLRESILQIAKISELERDDLIKKNMAST
ncbi:hypothetical protein HPP92_004463 [Vanilla planifolia]|uniref:Uncharacterized protein n=1 Tax=Vanilla planifolia TaxID=51239 RepID=A0A835RQE7_VANPL|nr:hypothetical protein HPP92_004463 [Vanilla planifolia]